MYQQCRLYDSSRVQGSKTAWYKDQQGLRNCGFGVVMTFIAEQGAQLYPFVKTEPTNLRLVLYYHCFHNPPFISPKNKTTDSALDVSE